MQTGTEGAMRRIGKRSRAIEAEVCAQCQDLQAPCSCASDMLVSHEEGLTTPATLKVRCNVTEGSRADVCTASTWDRVRVCR
eukprot:1160914-Pelagomonas_calceolata.AAC.10